MSCSGCIQQTGHCWRMKMSGALALCRDKQPYNDSLQILLLHCRKEIGLEMKGNDISSGERDLE